MFRTYESYKLVILTTVIAPLVLIDLCVLTRLVFRRLRSRVVRFVRLAPRTRGKKHNTTRIA